MHSWFVEPDEHDPLLGDRVLLGLGLRVLWVLGAGPGGRAEARDTRLDAGQVTEVPEDGVVDEAHLVDEALRALGVQLPGAVRPQPEPPLPFHPAAARRQGPVGVG